MKSKKQDFSMLVMLTSPERKCLRSDFARKAFKVSINSGYYLKAKLRLLTAPNKSYLLCNYSKWMGEQTPL